MSEWRETEPGTYVRECGAGMVGQVWVLGRYIHAAILLEWEQYPRTEHWQCMRHLETATDITRMMSVLDEHVAALLSWAERLVRPVEAVAIAVDGCNVVSVALDGELPQVLLNGAPAPEMAVVVTIAGALHGTPEAQRRIVEALGRVAECRGLLG